MRLRMRTRATPIRTRACRIAAACLIALAGCAAATSATTGPVEDPYARNHEASVDIRSKHTQPPTYPANAARDGIRGTTMVHVDVDAEGEVVAVSVSKSSGHAELDTAAVEAAEHWTYQSAMRDGRPAPGFVWIPVVFGD